MAKSPGWTKIFRRTDGAAEEPQLGAFLEGVSSIFEGASEEETFEQIRTEFRGLFGCADVTLFSFDPSVLPTPDEGDWVLTAKAGLGVGNRVCQTDAWTMPSLVPGRSFPHSEQLAQKAMLKAVALAFEESSFYGCDIEKKKVILLKDPRPEDDLGSGDLSVLAIPLTYHNRVGRITEKCRVGVLALYNTPIQRDVGEVERFLRSMVAFALVTPTCTLRDPVTTLYTERHLREQLELHMNMHRLTKGGVAGGFVVGMIDTLKLYKQSLETEGTVDPQTVSQHVSGVLRGVGSCVWRASRDYPLGPGVELRCGHAGRIGHEGFGVVLPLLKEQTLRMWAIKLSKAVIDYPFEGEKNLPTGDITVSLRLIPFGTRGTHDADAVWKLGLKCLEQIERDQVRARRDPKALAEAVNLTEVLDDEGAWQPVGNHPRARKPPADAAGPRRAPAPKGKRPPGRGGPGRPHP